MKDALGDRMKGFYEDRTRYHLTRRNYTIIRIDGKAFHTYTRGLNRPFDPGLIEDMNKTAEYLCKNIMGAKLAYVQSDEISLVITDFDDQNTQAWFDNNLQKMVSVSASMATRAFNEARMKRHHSSLDSFKWAEFDSRCFQIPTRMEVENYLIWRQQDATRNSIQSVAQSLYSSKELHGKKTDVLQEMIFQKGINWNDYLPREKRGAVIRKYVIKNIETDAIRSQWKADESTPVFSQDREYLRSIIPLNEPVWQE